MSELSDFQQQLREDLDNVFLNFDEFAEEVEINGTLTRVVIDEDELMQYKISSGEFFNTERDGLHQNELLFFVWQEEIPEKPFVDQHMRFNGKDYRVHDHKLDNGLYTIVLKGYRS